MAMDVVELSSTDPDVAHAQINAVYGSEQPVSFSGDPAGFRCELRMMTAGDVGLDVVRHTMAARAAAYTPDFFIGALGTHGVLHFDEGDDSVDVLPGTVVRYPLHYDSVYESSWSDIGIRLVRVPMAVVARVAAEQCGTAPGTLRFHGMAAGSRRGTTQWRHLTRYLHVQASAPSSALDHPLVQSSVATLVAATALATFPNNAVVTTDRTPPGDVAPAALRRAMDFVDANAHRPITVTDMANAVGVSPRALQQAFRRHRDTTPLRYLRTVRLHRAHDELADADADAGLTVAAVARRHGFADPVRFATYYRELFGVRPARTLRGS